MQLKELCSGVYNACPNIKSQSSFIEALFVASGSPSYISVSYKKGLFNSQKPFNLNQKSPLRGKDNLNDLISFFSTSIADGHVATLVSSFGIPEKDAPDKNALCVALAIQMKMLIDSDDEDVDNILILEYQKVKRDNETNTIETGRKPLFPGDSLYVSFKQGQKYIVSCYDTIKHSWTLQNTGTQTWVNRKLVFVKNKKTRPEANPNVIDIPLTKPGEFQTISTEFDARGFEGTFECLWEMRNEDDCDCFPGNTSMFCVTIDVKFKRI